MSVITPILDTLLHDVLGRRTAPPVLRSLNETVTPAWPAGMVKPGQEETVLDVRRAGVPEGAIARTGAQTAGSTAPSLGDYLPGGVQARLSPVAQVIAGLLGKFPAPLSTLRTLAPLLQDQAPVPPALLATQLQSSVNDSGLFYEAHLARWYRGTLPLAQLAREPQMQLPGAVRTPAGLTNSAVITNSGTITNSAATSLAVAVGTAAAATGLIEIAAGKDPRLNAAPEATTYSAAGRTASQQNVQQGLLPMPQASSAAVLEPGTDVSGSGRAAPGQATDSPAVTRAGPEISDALQGLLRHQLELLSVPVLRWEGEVWAGIFMQLMIQLPESAGRGEREGDDKDNDPGSVESEVTIDLRSLGLLKVKLHLHGEQLGLILRTDSLHAMQCLETGREALAARLRNCGFSAPGIQIKMLEEDGHD